MVLKSGDIINLPQDGYCLILSIGLSRARAIAIRHKCANDVISRGSGKICKEELHGDVISISPNSEVEVVGSHYWTIELPCTKLS